MRAAAVLHYLWLCAVIPAVIVWGILALAAKFIMDTITDWNRQGI